MGLYHHDDSDSHPAPAPSWGARVNFGDMIGRGSFPNNHNVKKRCQRKLTTFDFRGQFAHGDLPAILDRDVGRRLFRMGRGCIGRTRPIQKSGWGVGPGAPSQKAIAKSPWGVMAFLSKQIINVSESMLADKVPVGLIMKTFTQRLQKKPDFG